MSRAGVVFVHGQPAGVLREEPAEGQALAYVFTYDANYLAQANAQPISLTMPLRREPYRQDHLHPFFVSLLAEGALAEIQCRLLRIDERDLFGRVLITCRDTIGAVTVDRLEPTP